MGTSRTYFCIDIIIIMFRLPNMSYEPHGSKVVEYFSTNPDTGGLVGLERMWREHFLQVMKPEFLPPLWSVTHNANR